MITRTNDRLLTVFEHQSVRVGQAVGGVLFDENHLEALERYYGSGVPYFTLIHKGVKFNEHVGVLQVGSLTIEVLPKADQANDNEKWRAILIGVLKTVGAFEIHAPSSSFLSLKSNSILDLYLELFIIEVEALLHQGLVKRYRKTESNLTTLKGSIQFSRHIRTNIVHKERFYVRHTVYDHNHLLNLILYKAVKLVQKINTNAALASRVGALMLNFPEVPDCRVSREVFNRMVIDRKTEPYRRAIGIAELLLLNYHPDVLKGDKDVLAIMFDMNALWERFVFRSLQRYNTTAKIIQAQSSKPFWKPENGRRVMMRPDIVINKDQEDCIVLDTKWKNISGTNPSPDDLRQMYVYAEYYGACSTALVYPGSVDSTTEGVYYDGKGKEGRKSCGVVTIHVEPDVRRWQSNIASKLLGSIW